MLEWIKGLVIAFVQWALDVTLLRVGDEDAAIVIKPNGALEAAIPKKDDDLIEEDSPEWKGTMIMMILADPSWYADNSRRFDALATIDEDEDEARFFINGEEVSTSEKNLSYREIIGLGGGNQSLLYSMTAKFSGGSRIVSPSETIEVEEGMRINFSLTGSA